MDDDKSAWLKRVSEVFALVAVPLYVAGWAYRQRYLQAFGFSVIDTTSIPSADLTIISIRVLTSVWCVIALVIGIGVLQLVRWLLNRGRVRQELRVAVLSGLIIALTALLFLASARLAKDDAHRDIREETSHLPTVALRIRNEGSDSASELEHGRYEFKLLSRTQSRLYVFRPLSQADNVSYSPQVEIIGIKDADVSEIRILRPF